MSSLSIILQWCGQVYEDALQRIGVPLYVADRDGVFRWVNDSAENLVGDVVGRRISTVVAPEQISYARQQFAKKVAGQTVTTEYDLILLDRAGRRVPVRIHSAGLTRGGSFSAVLGAAFPQKAEPQPSESSSGDDRPRAQLTGRQHETVLLLGDGLSTTEIAARLGVSVATARNHIRAVMRALKVRTRLEAVAVAHRTGLLPKRS